MALEDINRKELQWKTTKKNGYLLEGFSKHNKDLSKKFLKDFELGVNVPKGRKGRRTAGTLLKLRGICLFLNKHFPKKNFEEIKKEQLHKLFNDMGEGKIKKEGGREYRDTGDFIKLVKVFWGWLKKTERVKEDITEDLARADYKKSKPAWVFLTNEQMRQLIDQARGDYRALILFFYDSGVRCAEGFRIRISDFSEDYQVLNIPDRREDGSKVSKTFERTIKLKQCSSLIKAYIKTNKLKNDDLLITQTQFAFNKYLRTLSKRLFGVKKTKSRGYTDKLKLTDIRHLSAIFWLDKYKKNSDLMYRMGWKREDKIFYYSEFLGRRDKIDDEDMITTADKSRYEKEIKELKTQQEEFKKFMKTNSGNLVINTKQLKNPESFKQIVEILKEASQKIK